MNLPVAESFDSDVVAIEAEDLCVSVGATGASGGCDGGGDEQGEDDELLAEDTTVRQAEDQLSPKIEDYGSEGSSFFFTWTFMVEEKHFLFFKRTDFIFDGFFCLSWDCMWLKGNWATDASVLSLWLFIVAGASLRGKDALWHLNLESSSTTDVQ